ncbi:alpha-glucan water dikinase [Cyclospora cayetanensis]|uniref:Alpha-glucan water dikinase n=1 Tax=Cyclospora cayetanensis TaxID=88456 RepID=A0A1D3CZQ9_9EIME|nr:alpha-glucan water dikinase [Cyclospora cayetanensis]
MAETQQESKFALPILEGSDADSLVVEFPVEGGRTLVCTVRRHPEPIAAETETVQVLLSFKAPFFMPHEGNKELFLHWGVAKNPGEWMAPEGEFRESLRSCGQRVKFGETATDIAFPSPSSSPPPVLDLTCPAHVAPEYLVFVLHSPPHEWFKQPNPGRPSTNFMLPLRQALNQMLSKVALLNAISAYKETQPIPDSEQQQQMSAEAARLEVVYGTFAHYPVDDKASQTAFEFCETSRSVGFQRVALCFRGDAVPPGLSFVLKEAKADRWFSDQSGDFFVKLPMHPHWEILKAKYKKIAEMRAIEEAREQEERRQKWNDAKQAFNIFVQEQNPETALAMRRVPLSDDVGEMLVRTEADATRNSIRISLTACLRTPCMLRWGMVDIMGRRQTELHSEKQASEEAARVAATRKGGRYQWICPPAEVRPPHTVVADPQRACETPFEDSPDGLLQCLEIHVPAAKALPQFEGDPGIQPLFEGFACCLRERSADRWYKAIDNRDIQIRLLDVENMPCKGENRDYLEKVVEAEVEWQHMTLMHRYNLMRQFYESFSRRSEERLHSSPDYGTRAQRVAELIRAWPRRQWEGDEAPLPEGFGCSMGRARAAHEAVAYNELATAEAAEEQEFWELMFTWARFAFLGLLDWQRNYNTKPRELAHACESLTFCAVRLWRCHPSHRTLIRSCLSTMGRGGSQGQAIRDKILEIMHKHHIPEHGSFYEQWHQKLHNNTTPDDIGICRAVIAFLESRGDLSAFWRVLSDHGITKERLASYERKITMEPHLVQTNINELVNDFKAYLSVIQDVHDARDARKAFDYARGYLQGDTVHMVETVLTEMGQRTDGMSPGEVHNRFVRLSEARRRLCFQLNENGSLSACDDSRVAETRELLMLDFVLEQQQGLLLQATAAFDVHQLATHLRELLLCLSAHDPANVELANLCADWQHLSGDLALACVSENSSSNECREAALLLKALLDRLSRFIGRQVDAVQEGLGPKAQYLGAQVGADKKALDFFVDEVLRGSSLLSVAFSIKRLEPFLRKTACLPAWQLISVVERVRGELVTIDQLSGIQDKVYESPTVLLCNAVSGEEEIPEGVQAVLVRSAAVSPDILSHVSVRARNAHVLLAVCFDEAESGKLEELAGEWVEVLCTRDGSSLSVAAAPDLRPDKAIQRACSGLFNRQASQLALEAYEEERTRKAKKHTDRNVALLDASADAPWALTPDRFTKSVVGSKSLNIGKLKASLPKDVLTPQSIALPFGSLQRTLHAPDNAQALQSLSSALRRLSSSLKNAEAEAIFDICRKAMLGVIVPTELRKALEEALQSIDGQGTSDEGSKCLGKRPRLMDLWRKNGDTKCAEALVEVWASLFGLRPWVSLTKASRDYCELNMAVLVQELLPVRYSFVLHTKNPFSQDPNELYGEIAPGLGEAIVGNYAGRALGWTQKRNGEPTVIAFLSKSVALTCEPCLIFRSDSNGEDLEGFAGAGLFESITAERSVWLPLCYCRQRLVNDRPYRQALLDKISKIGVLVEELYGEPQDIEGVVIGEDTIALVQTRPQV